MFLCVTRFIQCQTFFLINTIYTHKSNIMLQ